MGQVPYFVDGEFEGSVDSESLDGCGHLNKKMVGTCREGCCNDYVCTDCGEKFRVELPY